MSSLNSLQSLFMPGKGHVIRVPNRLAKGFLKRSVLAWMKKKQNKYTQHQGKRECERRRQHL